MIKTWQDARDAGMTQEALQELCDYDLALMEKIRTALRRKHPNASEKQIEHWTDRAMQRKYQQEHWGWSPIK